METTTEAGAQPATTTALAPVDTAAQVTAALAAERARMGGLDDLASHLNGQADGLRIIADAKTSGASVGDTAIALITGGVFAKVAALNGLQQDDNSAAAAVPAAATPDAAPTVAQTPEGWKAEYAASTALQSEFASAEQYVSYKRAEASGRVRVMGQRKAS